jgi:hypothetical protein
MFAEGNQFLSTDQFYDSKPLKENNNSNQSMTKEKHKIKQFLT